MRRTKRPRAGKSRFAAFKNMLNKHKILHWKGFILVPGQLGENQTLHLTFISSLRTHNISTIQQEPFGQLR
jgi:hypothetical protein